MKKDARIEAVCAFCEHATLDAEGSTVSCPYKRNATPEGHCRRFRYDPLKRIPRPKPPMPTLDEESVLKE